MSSELGIFLLAMLFGCFGSIVYGIVQFFVSLRDANKHTLTTNSFLDIEEKTKEPAFDMPLTIQFGKAPYKVEVVKSGKQYFVRLCFSSNGKIFMHSENYKNKSHATKQAEKLADELHTDIKYVGF